MNWIKKCSWTERIPLKSSFNKGIYWTIQQIIQDQNIKILDRMILGAEHIILKIIILEQYYFCGLFYVLQL